MCETFQMNIAPKPFKQLLTYMLSEIQECLVMLKSSDVMCLFAQV